MVARCCEKSLIGHETVSLLGLHSWDYLCLEVESMLIDSLRGISFKISSESVSEETKKKERKMKGRINEKKGKG